VARLRFGVVAFYVVEDFSPSEKELLRHYFTNLDQPVFALVNLPEVVKGALFARYSRSAKSLRRLFLDEFVGELDISGDHDIDATIGMRRAEELYEKVFLEYGDDSVAQLGGVHLACEQASNVLTKILEWGRLGSYLEQSTRYITYDARLGGRYRYLRDNDIGVSHFGTRYVGDMDRMFDAYSQLVPVLTEHFRAEIAKDPNDSDFIYRQAIRAKALDSLRGLLPSASLSNVGIYGSGQMYEQMLQRMRAHPLPEARTYGDMMLTELRKVIPSFLRRVDLPERGRAWSAYLSNTLEDTIDQATQLLADISPEPVPEVSLVDFDPEGEDKVLAAILYAVSDLPDHQLRQRVSQLSAQERVDLITSYVGDRTNRRHKPGRAFERTDYRFDILGDYGAFRDLQRHRLCTIEWQRLTPHHGYVRPQAVDDAGAAGVFDAVMERSSNLYELLATRYPEQASYAVSMAYRVRFIMQMNARESMHVIELRTGPQGHPSYRRVCQEMHRLIDQKAGHHAIAAAMRYVDYSEPALERLDAERKAEARRSVATVES
jgi:thymidylate synthase ThyX